jgi:hypothetical protein
MTARFLSIAEITVALGAIDLHHSFSPYDNRGIERHAIDDLVDDALDLWEPFFDRSQAHTFVFDKNTRIQGARVNNELLFAFEYTEPVRPRVMLSMWGVAGSSPSLISHRFFKPSTIQLLLAPETFALARARSEAHSIASVTMTGLIPSLGSTRI